MDTLWTVLFLTFEVESADGLPEDEPRTPFFDFEENTIKFVAIERETEEENFVDTLDVYCLGRPGSFVCLCLLLIVYSLPRPHRT